MRWLLAILIFGINFLFCEEPENKKIIILNSDEVFEGDYFAVGKTIEISGTVNGDVYAFGGQVFIDGHVTGDVLIAGGSVLISGNVDRGVRVCGGQVTLEGPIGGSVTVVSGDTTLGAFCKIKNNLVCLSGNVNLEAKVGGNGMIMASSARLSGDVDKNLRVYAGAIRVTSKAVVRGVFEYSSGAKALIDPAAELRGTIRFNKVVLEDLWRGAWIKAVFGQSKIIGLLMNFIFSFSFGLMLIKLFPKDLEHTINALKKFPIRSGIYGVVITVLLPFLALLLLMTVLGIPLALTLLAINVISFYAVKVFTIIWITNSLPIKLNLASHKYFALFIGLIVYFVLAEIPILGGWVAFLALILGLGGVVLGNIISHFHQIKP